LQQHERILRFETAMAGDVDIHARDGGHGDCCHDERRERVRDETQRAWRRLGRHAVQIALKCERDGMA
jgi:hypothetical protein